MKEVNLKMEFRSIKHPYLWIIGSLLLVILIIILLNKTGVFYLNIPQNDKESDIFILNWDLIVLVITLPLSYVIMNFFVKREIKKNE